VNPEYFDSLDIIPNAGQDIVEAKANKLNQILHTSLLSLKND
jgi:hypothetical protein